jgi:hypothetical protein
MCGDTGGKPGGSGAAFWRSEPWPQNIGRARNGYYRNWTGTEWVLQDGTVTTTPGIGDVGVLGGTLTGVTLPQSGTVSFFGETTTDIGTLMVDGTGP